MNTKIRDDFAVCEDSIYLDTAYIAPLAEPVLKAGTGFLERRSRGTAGRVEDWLGLMDTLRSSVGEWIHAKPNEIAFTTNTSDGTNFVAGSLNLGPGDNVVMDELDYPSNSAVWHACAGARGAEVRMVRAKDGAASVQDFATMVDDSTKVISVSYVSHRNGYRHDLKGLAELAHAHGAFLHVDGSQAIGALKFDVQESMVDFCTCGTYKWQLGPLGLAFFYVREDLLPMVESPTYGWMRVKTWADDAHLEPLELYESARKFESATVHFQGLFELNEAVKYIQGVGMENIERQVLGLSARLQRGLTDLDIAVMTPPGTQSSIVTCQVKNRERMNQLLKEKKVVVTMRPQEMRISPHFFNSEEDIDGLLNLMEEDR